MESLKFQIIARIIFKRYMVHLLLIRRIEQRNLEEIRITKMARAIGKQCFSCS